MITCLSRQRVLRCGKCCQRLPAPYYCASHCQAPSYLLKSAAITTKTLVILMFDRNKDKQQDKSETSGAAAPAAESSYSSTPRPATAAASSGKSATLGATIKVKGDISGDESLLIEGQVEGTVNLASHELTVGKSGKVHADVTAKVIRIDGEVHGDITGKEKVFVSSTSNIKGNIITPKMTLEEGARFKGTIDIDPSHANGSSPAASFKSGTPTDKTS